MNKKIVFLGAGSMAEALIAGMIKKGATLPGNLWVSNRSNDKQLNRLKNQYGITPCRDMPSLLTDADIVVIAVKPKDVYTALQQAKPYLKNTTLLISVAAGVSTKSLEAILENSMPIIRAMPNTSAAVGKSATALSGNKFMLDEDLILAKEIFNTVGMVVFTEEEKMDAVTGLSGSGPAYIYYLIEAMQQSAKQIGLEQKEAQTLIIQTLMGAAEMVHSSDKSPQTLRHEVTSPGGTTEAGIRILEHHGVKEAFINCIKEATLQSERMGKDLGNKIKEKILFE